jgi:hypothetical protein
MSSSTGRMNIKRRLKILRKHVHTDHKKIPSAKSTSDRVMPWRLLIEEFGPSFRHIKGKHNLIDDALQLNVWQP